MELDFTFYGFLLDEAGKASGPLKTLESYARALPPGSAVTLKVPQAVTAHHFFRAGKAEPNPGRHDPEAFRTRFYEPAVELLGPAIKAFLFEHEYKRKAEGPEPEENTDDQRTFFKKLPEDSRYHIEERTDRLRTPGYFSWLKSAGIGDVLSQWTYMPPLAQQAERASVLGPSTRVMRILTPPGMKYEDAYARYHPFDKMVDLDLATIQETVRVVSALSADGNKILVTVNNRAGGNAPEILRQISEAL